MLPAGSRSLLSRTSAVSLTCIIILTPGNVGRKPGHHFIRATSAVTAQSTTGRIICTLKCVIFVLISVFLTDSWHSQEGEQEASRLSGTSRQI
jgi:hypothetical protein